MKKQNLLNISWVIISLLPIIHLQQQQLQTLKQTPPPSTAQLQQQQNQEKIQLSLLQNTPDLGYKNLIANWTYLSFLQYFGDDQIREKTGFGLSPDYFQIIIDRDPRFVYSYLFLTSSISQYAGQPEKSIALIKQGLKSLTPQTPPNSYYVWRYKAIDQLLFLGDKKNAQISFENAAKWANYHSDPPSRTAAQLSQQTAQFLAKNPDSRSAQVSAWSMVYLGTPDPKIKQKAIQQIEALGGKITISNGRLAVTLPPID